MNMSSQGRCRAVAVVLAALIALTVILGGCASPPAAEQGSAPAGQEAGETPEGTSTEEDGAVALTAPQDAPTKPPAEASAPPAEQAAPSEAVAEPPTPSPAPPVAAAAVDWVGSAQKWVPIFSLETEGVYLGAAQVAGPSSQVAKVKGVAEMRLRFKDIGRIYAYVPVSTISLTKLNRVQGVSVWAVGDLQLVDL